MHFSLSTIATAALFFTATDAFPQRPHGTGVGQAHGTGRPQGSGSPRGTDVPDFPSGASFGAQPTGFGQAHGTGRPHGSGRPHRSGKPQGTGVPNSFPSGASFDTEAAGGRNSTRGRGGKGKGRFSRFPSGGFPSGMPTGGASFPSGGIPTAFPTGPAPTNAPSFPSGTDLPDVSSISFELPGTLNNAVNAAAQTSTKTKKSKSSKTSAAAVETATGAKDKSTAEPTASATQIESGNDAAATKTSATATKPTGSTGNNTSGGSTSATTTFPDAAGESTLSKPMTVTGAFDGGMVRFGRGVTCGGQSEGGDSDAVFLVEEGGSVSNVIIGADQGEGIHCLGSCTIENVWWEAVCEDALTIKQDSGTSYVIGGGAKGASDKVFQHNGGGTLNVKGFYATDFGKLYRSCGNCDSMFERHIVMDGVIADGGSATLVGINTNYGDTATITNSCITNTDPICTEFEGNDTGDEPTEVSTGISSSCIYTQADISAC